MTGPSPTNTDTSVIVLSTCQSNAKHFVFPDNQIIIDDESNDAENDDLKGNKTINN
eukprot:CAMPEP_0176353168 /NCGR_PEP_ID=MMETSP0126-20121128/11580_1 /TAXON_ID=141414 ORGANISM="Strombidinopsis acuminatum, Strain SPMC142" /NCGR_SAMPLE_ID=MMETSP0126 /ASSEMBLY_ACC=CAM_ASM_000229 /LENGTH=55 /DNA_ID=CAMNT_0017704659 /DNA_START=637 /DNA_END=804 /DNA_ORIENTATION=-